MSRGYSQLKAALSVARASFIATLRSPTSVVFSLLFPLIFIVVFGSMVDTARISFKVGIAPTCDTANILFRELARLPILELKEGADSATLMKDLRKGRITAILTIPHQGDIFPFPVMKLDLLSSSSSSDQFPFLKSTLQQLVDRINHRAFPHNPGIVRFQTREIPGRKYRKIDFILPGQLGFSLLMGGVFASAFLLFHLRQSQVLRRLYVTPIRKFYLILGELMSRLAFQVFTFLIIIGLGTFAFRFTLIHGIWTFLEMLFVSLFGLIIFMGIGFLISGLIRNESSITPIANTLTLPQILLCGLFFPLDQYPHWLQVFCKLLPLTFYVDSLRRIAFEGVHFWQMPREMGGLLVWTVLILLLTVRVFKWE